VALAGRGRKALRLANVRALPKMWDVGACRSPGARPGEG
jgi:hypothetical protein